MNARQIATAAPGTLHRTARDQRRTPSRLRDERAMTTAESTGYRECEGDLIMTRTTAATTIGLQQSKPSSPRRRRRAAQPGQLPCLLGAPMRLLALDASSTKIGWVICAGASVQDAGTITLTGHVIAGRCHQASCALEGVLARHLDVRMLAIEAPGSEHEADAPGIAWAALAQLTTPS